jgi:hypothetical protein
VHETCCILLSNPRFWWLDIYCKDRQPQSHCINKHITRFILINLISPPQSHNFTYIYTSHNFSLTPTNIPSLFLFLSFYFFIFYSMGAFTFDLKNLYELQSHFTNMHITRFILINLISPPQSHNFTYIYTSHNFSLTHNLIIHFKKAKKWIWTAQRYFFKNYLHIHHCRRSADGTTSFPLASYAPYVGWPPPWPDGRPSRAGKERIR